MSAFETGDLVKTYNKILDDYHLRIDFLEKFQNRMFQFVLTKTLERLKKLNNNYLFAV